MKITTLQATNLKGGTFTHSLKPLTVFHGDNGRGKTARLNAIRLGLLGYEPALGKRNQDTFQLSSADSMAVTLKTDAGMIMRTWNRKNDGGIKSDAVLPPGLTVPPMLLDISAYITLTEKERIAYVFSLSDAKLDVDTIKSTLKARTGKIIDEAIKAAEDVADMPAPQAMQHLVSRYAYKLKELKLEARTLKGAEVSAVAQTAPPDVSAKLDAARAELEAAVGKVATAKAQQATAGRRTELQAQIEAETPLAVGNAEEVKQRGLTLKTEMDALTVAAGMVGVTAAAVKTARQSLSDWTEELESSRKAAESDDCKCNLCGQKLPPAKLKKMKESLEETARSVAVKVDEAKQRLAAAESELAACEQASERLKVLEPELDSLRVLYAHHAFLTRAKEDLDALGTAGESVDIAALEADVENLRNEVAELEFMDKQHTAYLTEKQRQQTLEDKRAKNASDIAQVEAIVGVLTFVQTTTMATVFGKLMDVANQFIEGMPMFFGGKLEFQSGEVVLVSGDKIIPFATLSDSQQLIVGMALGVALAAQSPIKIALFDRFEAVVAEHRAAFVIRLYELIEDKVIDQAVLALAATPPSGTMDDYLAVEVE